MKHSIHNGQNGFTIIEVVLFLAISSVLTLTLLGGWGISVNTQTYKDSVRSLSGTLQSEYSKTYNVTNDRAASISCLSSGATVNVVSGGASTTSRGASNCVAMGRYIVVNNKDITSQLIVGVESTTIAPGSSEVTIMKAYKPTAVDSSIVPATSWQIPWGSFTYTSSTNSSVQHFAMVIMRSPVSGTVSTYILDFSGSQPSIPVVLGTGATNASRTICLDPGAPIAQTRLGVIISKNAASSSSISVTTDGTGNICQ